MGRVAVMVLVSGQKKVWEALSGISGGWGELRDNTIMVGELAPISLDQLVRIIKVWDRLKRGEPYKGLGKANSQDRARAEIVNPGAD